MSVPIVIDIISDLVEIVRSVASIESDVRRLHEVREALRAHPHVETDQQVRFRYNEYEIAPGWESRNLVEATMLQSIRHLGIAIAREVVKIIPVGEGQDVLITRYWACPGERMVRAHQTTQQFRPQACERFRSELQVLADHGKMHPYVRGLYHWLVSSETETIVLDSWTAVRECESEEYAELMQTVDYLLESRSGIK